MSFELLRAYVRLYTRGFGRAQREIDATRRRMSFLRQFADRLRFSFIASAAALLSFSAALAAFRSAARFERQDIAIQALLGERARRDIRDLRALNLPSPFRREVLPSFQQLLAVGAPLEDSKELLEALNAIRLGSPSSNLQRIVFNLGQVQAKGRATAIDLREFANQGIPIYGALAQVIGKSGDELQKMIESGNIGFEVTREALALISENQFPGIAALNARGLTGTLSRIADRTDEITIAFAKLTRPLTETLNVLLRISSLTFGGIASAFGPVTGFFNVLIRGVDDGLQFFSQINENLRPPSFRTIEEDNRIKALDVESRNLSRSARERRQIFSQIFPEQAAADRLRQTIDAVNNARDDTFTDDQELAIFRAARRRFLGDTSGGGGVARPVVTSDVGLAARLAQQQREQQTVIGILSESENLLRDSNALLRQIAEETGVDVTLENPVRVEADN